MATKKSIRKNKRTPNRKKHKPTVKIQGKKIKLNELYKTKKEAEIRLMQLLDETQLEEGEIIKTKGQEYNTKKHTAWAHKFIKRKNRIYEKPKYHYDKKKEQDWGIMNLIKLRQR